MRTPRWTVCFLRTNWYCMCGSSQPGLQHAFDRFSAACDQVGTQISSEKIEVLLYVSLRCPRPLLSANEWKYTAADGGVQVHWGGIHVWWKSEQRNWDTAGEANTVLRELYCSVVTKWEFLNRSLFQSSPVVMNLRWPLKEYCQQNKRPSWDICEESTVWHFVTRSTCLKSVKLGMWSHFSESTDPSYVSSAMCPQCPRKE